MIFFLLIIYQIFCSKHIKVLIAVTNVDKLGETGQKTGWWLSEVAHPYHEFMNMNFTVDFISPLGGKTPVDEASVEDARKDDPISMSFYNDKHTFSRVAEYSLSPIQLSIPTLYSAIIFAGGHGVMWDFPEAVELHKIATSIYEQGGVVAAVCHGPAGIVNVKAPNSDEYLISGKNVTGFSNVEEIQIKLDKIVPFSLEDTLVKRGGLYSKGEPWSSHVVNFERVITGQNPQSAQELGVSVANTLISIKNRKGKFN